MLWDGSEIFKLLPFCNSYIERRKIKKLNNVQLLTELPFYDDLNIAKNKTTFSGFQEVIKLEFLIKEM